MSGGNRIKELGGQGQSVWLDFIRRSLIDSGELAGLVDEGVMGVTSNPSIFQKAIGASDDYDAALEKLRADCQDDPKRVYEVLAIEDIQRAADVLRPVYDRTDGADGFVSLEVSPYLARDTDGTLEEARRLWSTVDRPNLMIKVPGTVEGVPAIRQLISEGINVNVTLLFSIDAYERVADAYQEGVKAFVAGGGQASRVSSVASFFVSRIDTAVDKQLAEHEDASAADLAGKIAIANAKRAYRGYLERIETADWKELAAQGARPQRLLWASTGTKNKNYSDVLYVDELIGQDTVNTVPPATLDAFRDHGSVRVTLTEDVDEALQALRRLDALGISLDAITDQLLEDGIKAFADAFTQLLETVAAQAAC